MDLHGGKKKQIKESFFAGVITGAKSGASEMRPLMVSIADYGKQIGRAHV